MKIDSFLKNNLIMFAATSATAFFNLLYQLVMLRLVRREVFASLNSLLSLLVIISVPALAFSTMVTKHVSSNSARGEIERLKDVWRKLMRQVFCFGLIIFLLIVMLKSGIAFFLNIESGSSIVILGGIFFASCILPVMMGGLQGLEKFKWIALISVSGGFLKLLFSAGLVKGPMGMLNGALSGFLLATTVGIIIAIWPLRFMLSGQQGEKVNAKNIYTYIFPVLAVSFCFAIFTNIDMLLVKHYFNVESQDYAIAQMVGKIVLCIPGMIYVVMFSRASKLHALEKGSAVILKQSIFFAFALALAAASLFNFAPEFFLKILAGSFSSRVILLSRVFSLAMLFYALNNILFYYQLSIEHYGFIRPLFFMAFLQVSAICLFHKTPLWVVNITLINAAVLLLLNLRSAFNAASCYEKYQG